jgi:NADPH2:quinone reductase
VVLIGNRGTNNQGTVEINPRAAMSRDAAILGMTLMNVSPPDMARIHAALIAGLESGTLRPVIGQEFPLADAPKAHHAVIEANAYGKIVLIP